MGSAALRLGLVQDAPIVRDMKETLSCMAQYAERAASKELSIDILAFPELFVSGYSPNVWERWPTPDDEMYWIDQMMGLARMYGVWIMFGHPSFRAETRREGTSRYQAVMLNDPSAEMYNAVSLVSPFQLVGTYAKVHLYGEERNLFTPGDVFPVWETPWTQIAPQICFDVEFPEAARSVALAGARLIVYTSNNMHPYSQWHRTFSQARALENRVFVANVNRLGDECGVSFCGHSCVFHPGGQTLIDVGEERGLFVCDINLKERDMLDENLDYLRLRRPKAYTL